jgi:hypothetical protein
MHSSLVKGFDTAEKTRDGISHRISDHAGHFDWPAGHNSRMVGERGRPSRGRIRRKGALGLSTRSHLGHWFKCSRNATRFRRWNVIRRLSGRGMIYLRPFPFFYHASMYLLPRGNFQGFLAPMHDGGLVAPIEQLGHGSAMRTAGAVSVHRRLIFPNRNGPKNFLGVE